MSIRKSQSEIHDMSIYKTPIATLDFLEYSSLKAKFEYFKICCIVGDSERKHVEETVVAQTQHFTESNQ